MSSCFISWSQDELFQQEDSVKKHSPKKAVLLSTCLPGAGQVYNHFAISKGKRKAFWKVPLIYAGLSAATYFLIQNQLTQNALKIDYINRKNGGTPDTRWIQFDDDGILMLYNQYLTRRDLSMLGVGAVYLVQMIDAGIEAHFVNFDVSEDLSMKITPTILGVSSPGLKVQFNFHKKETSAFF
jgi:hypothetical protein